MFQKPFVGGVTSGPAEGVQSAPPNPLTGLGKFSGRAEGEKEGKVSRGGTAEKGKEIGRKGREKKGRKEEGYG